LQPAISSRAARHSPLPLGFILPCLPTPANQCKSGPAWVHEIKHDGYRLIARRTGDRGRLYPPRRMLVSDQPWGPPRRRKR
jgi:ATP-dependent DNA ligase